MKYNYDQSNMLILFNRMLQQATEVELSLLALQESVELLAAVAELDTAQIPPVCLEIAQLCGRLVV